VPSQLDNCSCTIMYEKCRISLNLWDASYDGYDRLRPLMYPETGCFLLCFSVVDPTSLQNVVMKWLPEVQYYCPDIPYILVGTKVDLRKNADILRELKERNEIPVSLAMGVKVAREIHAYHYLECSARTQKGLKTLFDEVSKVLILREVGGKRKRKGLRGWMDRIGRGKDHNLGMDEYRASNLKRLKEIDIGEMERQEIARLKEELKREMMDARMYQKDFGLLSRDVILEILSEYHCVDLELDCREFLPKYFVFQDELGMRTHKVLNKFFGYFANDRGRQIVQLFYNFTCESYDHMKKHLPIVKRMLHLAVLPCHGSTLRTHSYTYFRDYYHQRDTKNNVCVSALDAMEYPRDFEIWGNGRSSTVVDVNLRWTGTFLGRDASILTKLNVKYPYLSSLRMFRDFKKTFFITPSEGDMEFFNLRRLALHNMSLQSHWTFEKLPNLEDLTIVLRSGGREEISLEQFRVLMNLPHLNKFCAVRVGFGQIQNDFDLLFSDNSRIETIIFSECIFDLQALDESCNIMGAGMQLMVICNVKPLEHHAEKFNDKFVEDVLRFAEENDEFQYVLMSKTQKRVTNIAGKIITIDIGRWELPLRLL